MVSHKLFVFFITCFRALTAAILCNVFRCNVNIATYIKIGFIFNRRKISQYKTTNNTN